MKKTDAIKLLGGSVAEAAQAVGSTYQAVDKWPDELPVRIADRVTAAYARKCAQEGHQEAFWDYMRNAELRAASVGA